MKKIALFGGSFNPPHDGHFNMASYIHDVLNADEVWLLFSVNRLKDPSKYASLNHRMAMGEIMKTQFNNAAIVLSDIEEELGTHITYDVLTKLKAKFPDTQFIWVMGADNLENFHKWDSWENILNEFPVAVVDRPPYSSDAHNSIAAKTYAHLKHRNIDDLTQAGQGWHYLEGPLYNLSSSNLLEQMRNGRTQFDGAFQKVADYILKHELYGVGTPTVLLDKNEPTFTPS
jgi:nicotinate-nucleotide adenylyltransferase